MIKSYSFVLMLLILKTSSAQIPSSIDLQHIGFVSNNVGIRNSGDNTNRLFVINQEGIVRVTDNQGNLLVVPFLDIKNKVQFGGERGLLGLAFHPDYANNGLFFVNYSKKTPNTGDTIIERYQVSIDSNIADNSSGQVLMRIPQPYSNHNGGNLAFGPDNYLYIGMGDGGSGNDPDNSSQTFHTLLGKMLRIDVDGQLDMSDHACGQGITLNLYGIPNDNPFANDPIGVGTSCDETWATGLRNPWRWSFDSLTGDLIIGDVGQNSIEEIDFQTNTSTGGENYGWNCNEGTRDNTDDINDPIVSCQTPPVFTNPVLEKNHTENRCSITGGYVYRGPISSIVGEYIYGDYCSGQIWFANPNNEWAESEWNQSTANFQFKLSSFGEDEVGNVYISTLDGDFYKIIDSNLFSNGFE